MKYDGRLIDSHIHIRGIHQPAYDLALPQMEACRQRFLQQLN